ncbi:MAG: hypothetical protein JW837_13130 [Sedimentisphaerales bacterium]|nr:hypothetical protein [Sedimentisphaerales bacterium]
MKYSLIISMILSLFVASYLAGRTADSQKQTTLTINVINRTENGTATLNDEVFVTIFEQTKPLQTLEGRVDSQGKVVFKEVPTGNNIIALPAVKHRDMTFNGHPVMLTPEQIAFNAHVEVFEVSTDKSKLSVAAHHFIIKLQADSIRISEYMRLQNSSDTAIIAEQKDENDKNKVIEVLLPKGFKNLTCSRFFRENALVVTKKGFYDTMAIPPGQFDAEFSYSLKIDSETIGITKTISLPTSDFMIFSQSDNNKVKVKGLGDSKGTLKLADGSSAEYFVFPGLKAGEQINFQLAGFNVKVSNSRTLTILIAIFALIALLVILRIFTQKS